MKDERVFIAVVCALGLGAVSAFGYLAWNAYVAGAAKEPARRAALAQCEDVPEVMPITVGMGACNLVNNSKYSNIQPEHYRELKDEFGVYETVQYPDGTLITLRNGTVTSVMTNGLD